MGGGLVLEGRIWRGWNGMAGELGHCNVEPEGHHCGCGSWGCLEQYASATAVVRMAHEAVALLTQAGTGQQAALRSLTQAGTGQQTALRSLTPAGTGQQAALRSLTPAGQPTALRSLTTETGGMTSRMVYECAMAGDAAAKKVFERVGRALGVAIADMVNILNLPLYVIGGGVSSAWDAFAPAMFAEVRKRSFVYAGTTAENGEGVGTTGIALLPATGAGRVSLRCRPRAGAVTLRCRPRASAEESA